MTDAELLEHDPVAAYLCQWLVWRSTPDDSVAEESEFSQLLLTGANLTEDQMLEVTDRRRRLYEHEGART